MTKQKNEKYVVFGSTVLNIPAKMIDVDNRGNKHLYNTITKKHNLAVHNGKSAINMKNNTNNNMKIARVANSSIRDYIENTAQIRSSINTRKISNQAIAQDVERELALPSQEINTSAPASFLQNKIRATLQRNRLLLGKEIISKLQANIRSKLANQNVNKELNAAAKIRNFFKNYKATLPAKELKANLRRERNRKRLQQITEQYKAPVSLTEYKPIYRPELTEEEKQLQEERRQVRMAINEKRKQEDKKYQARQQQLSTLAKILTQTMPINKDNRETLSAITRLQGLFRRNMSKNEISKRRLN